MLDCGITELRMDKASHGQKLSPVGHGPIHNPPPASPAAGLIQPKAAHTQIPSAGDFRTETRPAPPVYRPHQTSMHGVQQKAVPNFRLEKRPAPPVYRPQFGGPQTPPGPVQTQNRIAAQPKPVTAKPSVVPALASRTAAPVQRKPSAPWFVPAGPIQMMNTRFTKRSEDSSEDAVMPDAEALEGKEKESGGTIRHRGDSLGSYNQQKKATSHAKEDIEGKANVYPSLPDDVQEEVQKLAFGFTSEARVGVRKKISDTYIVSMAFISTDKEKRSEVTPTPNGTCLATFRMIGQIVKNKFVEIAGTSYVNVQPEGAYGYDTEFQSSHVIPSMLLSSDKRAIGNTGVQKTSFVNQSYDRGSEEAIFKLASSIDDPVFVGVELLASKKK